MSNSKICIITPRSLNDSPCLEKYNSLIKEPYDIIYWSKGESEGECGASNYYKYYGIVPVEGGTMSKIKHYLLFTRFVVKILKNNDYEKLIIFPTHMAWLLLGLLVHQYKNNYILDIRDYAGENNRVINFFTSTAVKNAGLCSITSPSYMNFLPNGIEYVVSHNIQVIDDSIIKAYRNRIKNENDPIVLSFIGTIRFIEQQEILISRFANDSRFVLRYIGRGSDALYDFIENNSIRNVQLVGQFERKQLGKFYSDTDFAINIYGNSNPALVYALSNKLYSAAMMGMPVLASPNTFTSKIIEKYDLGLTVDIDSISCPDKVFEYYKNFDESVFYSNCDTFLNHVYSDEEIFKKRIIEFLEG